LVGGGGVNHGQEHHTVAEGSRESDLESSLVRLSRSQKAAPTCRS
jgi:hypothetical protein